MNALQEMELESLPEPLNEITGTEEQRFEIKDINAANWALRKIAAAQAALGERQALAKAERERIDRWLMDQTQELQRTVDFFTTLLEAYHRRQFAENPRIKTIKLPHGVLKLRAQQPVYQRDEMVLKKWAGENKPETLVPQDPKLDWATLKKSIKVIDDKAVDPDTGEVVPGIVVIQREPRFTVEVD